MTQINIRPATVKDAPFIALVVAMAIHDEVTLHKYCGEDYLSVLTSVARAESTQYSWQNAIIAECAGLAVGAVVGYDGARLKELRNGTFEVLRECVGGVPNMVDETEAGEYYLDSLAVLPEYRGKGIGACLLHAFCERAFSEGAERVGLIVDIDNPNAEKLYVAQGFEYVGERIFLGHQMRHLQECNKK